MAKYILNTSFHISESVIPLFETWVKEIYIPKALNSGIFTDHTFTRLLVDVEPGTLRRHRKSYSLARHHRSKPKKQTSLPVRQASRFLHYIHGNNLTPPIKTWMNHYDNGIE